MTAESLLWTLHLGNPVWQQAKREVHSSDVEKDASQLLFHKEFDSAETLLNLEVNLLLGH